MKKEEFLTKLKKNLSVLEETEIRDIVQEYEQHIDMKMREGLSEEAAIRDFGDLKELTSGILEAYHVKADYKEETKKNIDFEKVKEESRKATDAIGKGAGAVGKGMESMGKWGKRQMEKVWNLMKYPFTKMKNLLSGSRKKAKGMGIFGRIWLFFLECCKMVWRAAKWCVRCAWNLACGFMAILTGCMTLGCIFLFGTLVVLNVLGYPVTGFILITLGSGLISCAAMLFCFSLIKRKRKDKEDSDTKDIHTDKKEEEEKDGEYPEKEEWEEEKWKVSSGQEVFRHA